MTEFKGKVEIQDSTGSNTTVRLDGDKGTINFYNTSDPWAMISIDANTGQMTFNAGTGVDGLSLSGGSIGVKDGSGEDKITVDADDSTVLLRDNFGKDSIVLNGANNIVRIYDGSGKEVLALHANAVDGGYAGLFLGAHKKPGILVMRDAADRDSIILNGLTGEMNVYDEDGKRSLSVKGKAVDARSAEMTIGAAPGDSPSGAKAGYLEIRNASGNRSIILNGVNNSMALRDEAGANKIILDGAGGDIILANADCAEDFDICQSELSQVEPGTVMVIDSVNTLRVSSKPYDKRVAGVVSGAGDYKPGLVLDKKQSQDCRKSISLMGKVKCKVDATCSSIEIGDLLTTSYTVGHAMRVNDPFKGFGAVIGKALQPLKAGQGIIAILVALQ